MEVRAGEEVGEARHLPRIGETAPDFEAASTFGTIRLEDFRGSWLIFFSHPADFS
jgi:peroxiredoxin (alkyl hydroperoxide reductase subunit C)